MMSNRRGTPPVKSWASDALDAVVGSQSVTITLPAGQSGVPVVLRASGAVGALIQFDIGNGAQKSLTVNPNAAPQEIPLPASAFPLGTQSVTMTVIASAAGYVFIEVGFS